MDRISPCLLLLVSVVRALLALLALLQNPCVAAESLPFRLVVNHGRGGVFAGAAADPGCPSAGIGLRTALETPEC